MTSADVNASSAQLSPQQCVRIARRVTWVGFWCNAALGTAKVVAGVVGRSGAVVADGIHSFTDFITDAIVLVMVTIGRRGANRRYEYGHGKYETLAEAIIAIALVLVGVAIFWDGTKMIVLSIEGNPIPRPGYIALAMCAASILVKEWLYRYTRRAGERIHSGAVVANAWHHRSDSLSSIATLAGVCAAMFLGESARIFDPIAQMVVAVFIVGVGAKMILPALRELLEEALPEEQQTVIRRTIAQTDGVRAYHHLRTRRNGHTVIIDAHIKVDPCITVVRAHEIADDVERRIAQAMGSASVTTHIEPYNDQPVAPDGSCED